MKTYTKRELDIILSLHKEWAKNNSKGKRANLSCKDLRYADLRYADLRDADLSYADLRYANLRGADLRCANLSNAALRYANLRDADLRDADLRDADLRSTDLRCANLSNAALSNVEYNYLSVGLNLSCPEEGEFIGFKKAVNDAIVKILITEDAKRSSATTRKCRASKVKVLEISEGITEVASKWDKSFIYKVGEIIEVKNFDENRWNECSTGIHFFLTRKEAEEY